MGEHARFSSKEHSTSTFNYSFFAVILRKSYIRCQLTVEIILKIYGIQDGIGITSYTNFQEEGMDAADNYEFISRSRVIFGKNIVSTLFYYILYEILLHHQS